MNIFVTHTSKIGGSMAVLTHLSREGDVWIFRDSMKFPVFILKVIYFYFKYMRQGAKFVFSDHFGGMFFYIPGETYVMANWFLEHFPKDSRIKRIVRCALVSLSTFRKRTLFASKYSMKCFLISCSFPFQIRDNIGVFLHPVPNKVPVSDCRDIDLLFVGRNDNIQKNYHIFKQVESALKASSMKVMEITPDVNKETQGYKSEYLSRAKFFFGLSNFESFGMAHIEAYQHGCKIITDLSRVPSLLELECRLENIENIELNSIASDRELVDFIVEIIRG